MDAEWTHGKESGNASRRLGAYEHGTCGAQGRNSGCDIGDYAGCRIGPTHPSEPLQFGRAHQRETRINPTMDGDRDGPILALPVELTRALQGLQGREHGAPRMALWICIGK